MVCDLRNNTFYARLELLRPGATEPVVIDARPSDAIAPRRAPRDPIFVADEVLEAVVTSSPDEA